MVMMKSDGVSNVNLSNFPIGKIAKVEGGGMPGTKGSEDRYFRVDGIEDGRVFGTPVTDLSQFGNRLCVLA